MTTSSTPNPRVTVMLPFLNGGPAFVPAVRSILNQTFTDWELLLCDDGSTDGSLEFARSLQLQDPRVIVWSDGQSKGLAARLNECIQRARGAWIARMDADDISYPDRFRRQVEYLSAHPEIDLLGCSMLICEESGSPIGKRTAPASHAEIVANPALGFGLAHPTWMARATWYRQFLYDPTALRFEDIELLYRAAPTSRFANITEPLYGYREMRGGLNKRSKTRLGRIRYLHARKAGLGVGLLARATAAEATKVVLDAALTTAGARYSWLRLREVALSAEEIADWNSILAALANPSYANAWRERTVA